MIAPTYGAELGLAVEAFPLEAWLAKQGFEPIGRFEWLGTCPRCGKRKLQVHAGRRLWHCWVCHQRELYAGQWRTTAGAGGVLRLVAWCFGLWMRDAAVVVLAEARPHLRLDNLPDLTLAAEQIEAGNDVFALLPNPPPGEAKKICGNLPYLASRGIGEADVAAYGLLACESGRFAGRVLFPDWTRGSTRYWQARATFPNPARKALNPDALPGHVTSEHSLFNLERAVDLGRGHVAICEGPISAIHAGDDAVASWGKRLSAAQILLMVRAGVRSVELYYDGPSEREPVGAWPEMLALGPLLASFFEVSLSFVPRGDPGDFSRDDNQAIRSERQPFAAFGKGRL